MSQRMQNKVVLITGAANGIGAAAAERMAAEGAKLLLIDRDAAALQALAGRIGPAAVWMEADVTADDTATTYVRRAQEAHGRIDAVLLNAGIEGQVASIDTLPMEIFDRVQAVNVRAVWMGLAALLPAMRGTGGSIVITSSTSGLRGSPNLAAYVTSKHAVMGMMRCAALEGAPHGIRVNCVNPGPTSTRMIDALDEGATTIGAATDTAAAVQARKTRIPLHRYGTVQEIASLMLYLTSDEASFCTGGYYLADGGIISGGF